MTTYRIESDVGLVLGDYEGESVRDALEALARDAGYRGLDHQIEALHGSDLRDWIKQTAKPGVDAAVVLDEAVESLAQDFARQADANYELAGQYTLSGRPEIFRARGRVIIMAETT